MLLKAPSSEVKHVGDTHYRYRVNSLIIITGASALHLAIAYNNLELIKLLVEAGAAIDQRAVGILLPSIGTMGVL